MPWALPWSEQAWRCLGVPDMAQCEINENIGEGCHGRLVPDWLRLRH